MAVWNDSVASWLDVADDFKYRTVDETVADGLARARALLLAADKEGFTALHRAAMAVGVALFMSLSCRPTGIICIRAIPNCADSTQSVPMKNTGWRGSDCSARGQGEAKLPQGKVRSVPPCLCPRALSSLILESIIWRVVWRPV
jgi:hypothetical protein